MTTFLIAFAVMALAVAAMSVGVMVTGREIKGSCGGVNSVDGAECACGATCDKSGAERAR